MGLAMPILGAVGAVAGIVGAGASVMGTLASANAAKAQGQAQSQMYGYEAKVATNNALIAEQNAAETARAGETTAFNVGEQGAQRIGEMKATMGARGVDVNSGSNAASLEGAHEVVATDIGTVRSNAAQAIYGYQTQAESSAAQAGLDTMGASQSLVAGNLGSEASLLNGVSSLGANWNKFQLGSSINSIGAMASNGISGFVGSG